MQTPKLAPIRLASFLDASARRTLYKAVGILAALTVFFLFWDSLLHLLLEGLHLVVEFLEVTLEGLLEKGFGLAPRQAQAILAWSALGLVVYGSVVLVRKAYEAALRAFAIGQAYYCSFLDSAKAAYEKATWFYIAGIAAAVGMAVYLFL